MPFLEIALLFLRKGLPVFAQTSSRIPPAFNSSTGLEEALPSALVGGWQGGIAEMLCQNPRLTMRDRLCSDDDDGHGLKTGLVQGKEASQDSGERVDGVVMHLNDSP